MFIDGDINGRGIMMKDNRYISGYWDTWQSVHQAVLLDRGSTVYQGTVENWKRNGDGIQMVLSSNDRYKLVIIEGLF